MPTLPKPDDSLIQAFAPHFSNCIWQHAQVLLLGAILTPGRRTVTAVLRIMGLSAGTALSDLPSRAQSGGLVELGAEPDAAEAAGADLCADGADHLCAGSDGRAPARGRHRHLRPVQVSKPKASIAIQCVRAIRIL